MSNKESVEWDEAESDEINYVAGTALLAGGGVVFDFLADVFLGLAAATTGGEFPNGGRTTGATWIVKSNNYI